MATKIKRKILNVDPISETAKLRFNTEMDQLHSCYVDEEKSDVVYLTSINNKYKFIMNKKTDSNWRIVK